MGEWLDAHVFNIIEDPKNHENEFPDERLVLKRNVNFPMIIALSIITMIDLCNLEFSLNNICLRTENYIKKIGTA